jgi:hypothetical protein
MIARNPLEFHLLDSLPNGRTFNAEYYRDNILSALPPVRSQTIGRKVMTHPDNASPHTSRKCTTFCAERGLRLAAYPPHLPDLALSDFFFFGHVKHCLQGSISRSRG